MQYKSDLKNAYAAWMASFFLFACSAAIFWPGSMSTDAVGQYANAVSGIYTDHHPPLMSFLWRYLDKIYPGSGTIFVFHLLMLYAANAIFIYIFRESKFKWWYVIYPLLPNILAYTILIVKDTGFTYAYLLSAAIMSLLVTYNVQKYKLPLLLLSIMLLLYGTAIKFQAQYILIFFTAGVAYCIHHYKFNRYTIISTVLIYLSIMLSINHINSILVPAQQKQHSWQLVKLFDLSAISIELNQPLYPNFVLKQENFDFIRIQTLFEPSKVDNLVFDAKPVLKIGNTAAERAELWDFWFMTIRQHPWLYLKIRLKMFSYNLTISPCNQNSPTKFLKQTSLGTIISNPFINNTIDSIHSTFKYLLRFMWALPFLLIYFVLSIMGIKKHKHAVPLLMFTSSSLALLSILMFFAMAGTARYVFFCVCFLHAAHGFVYSMLREATIAKTRRLISPSVVTR